MTYKPHLVFPGDKFGRFTVLNYSHNDKRSRRFYAVRCDCGREKTVQGTLLRIGNTKSCGCFSHDIKKAKALPNYRGVINHIVLQYKRHARNRGLAFNLPFELIDQIVRMPCHYCGIVGGNLKKTKNCKKGFRHNGIDRVDSRLGYELENVVPCCGLCNRAKRDIPRDKFIAWACRIANYQSHAHHPGTPTQ